MKTENSILKPDSTVSLNSENQIDGLNLLSQIEAEAVSAVFFDPEYSGAAGKMKIGNVGKKRQVRRYKLPQMGDETIQQFISEIARILKPSGYLFIWVDKLYVCGVQNWIGETGLERKDIITWNKVRMGMGSRTRSLAEYLLVFQKSPCWGRKTWKTQPVICDVWEEKIPTAEKKKHPHAKPIGLQEALIEAVTNPGDVICDPAAGSYSVLKACKNAGKRIFIGGDLLPVSGDTCAFTVCEPLHQSEKSKQLSIF